MGLLSFRVLWSYHTVPQGQGQGRLAECEAIRKAEDRTLQEVCWSWGPAQGLIGRAGHTKAQSQCWNEGVPNWGRGCFLWGTKAVRKISQQQNRDSGKKKRSLFRSWMDYIVIQALHYKISAISWFISVFTTNQTLRLFMALAGHINRTQVNWSVLSNPGRNAGYQPGYQPWKLKDIGMDWHQQIRVIYHEIKPPIAISKRTQSLEWKGWSHSAQHNA